MRKSAFLNAAILTLSASPWWVTHRVIARLAVALGLTIAACMTSVDWALALAAWPAAPLAAGFIAVALRSGSDLALARRQRACLVQSLGLYVSPPLLRTLLDGPRAPLRGRRRLAFLFADIKGFTAWSESVEPAQAFDLLNRYFAAVTPHIHRRGGTIDNFRGDGLMALFGAPEPHANPCRGAFEAARDLLAHGRAVLGARPTPDGRTAHGLDLGIGIAFGEAVFGDVGSSDRANFTAIGDPVNVAARLQDLSQSLGYPVLMTMDVVECLRDDDASTGGLDPAQVSPLGPVELRGHSPVRVAGWRPV